MAARRVTLLLIVGITACGRTGFDGGVDPVPTEEQTPAPTATATATAIVPQAVTAEVVYSSSSRGAFSPLFEMSLPKLAADDAYYYAAHASLNASPDNRYVRVLRKRRDAAPGASWESAAMLPRPGLQPAGLAMDALDRLHVVFQCTRDQGGAIEIDIGGGGGDRCFSTFDAGSGARAWHVTFSTRAGDVLRFDDPFGSTSESMDESNGNFGLGVATDRVWWSTLGPSGERVVRASDSPGMWSEVTLPALASDRIAVEPLFARALTGGRDALLLAGEWDTSQNALVAAAGFTSMQFAMSEVVRRDVSGALPLDVAYEPDGTIVVLAASGTSEEILRFDNGLGAAPIVLPIEVSGSARLQINSRGHWYLLDAGSGQTVSLRTSVDRGATWTEHPVAIAGLPQGTGETSFEHFTPLEPHSAAKAYDPDRFVFLFTGKSSQGYRTTYLGTMNLK
jgi:hypothetical protein